MRLDHIVFGAADLQQGIAFMRDALGADPVGGGKHDLMGTHNALWRLEADKYPVYLEVIAVDPNGDAPSRPRWFGLDDPLVRVRLAQGPCLLAYVAQTDDMETDRLKFPVDPGLPIHVKRGELAWDFCLPQDGALIEGGTLPYLIQWPEGVHPVKGMPVQDIRLASVAGRRINALDLVWPCDCRDDEIIGFSVTLQTARGVEVDFSML